MGVAPCLRIKWGSEWAGDGAQRVLGTGRASQPCGRAELSPPPHLSAGGGRPKGLSCPARHQRPQAEGCLTPAFLVGVVEPHGPDSPGGEESQSEVSQGHAP